MVIAGAVVGVVLVAGFRYVVPEVVAAGLERELSARGFPNARFHIDRVGLGHVRLSGVTLGDGLELGEVELDAGISMLWGGSAEQITIRRARISADALERPTPGGDGTGLAARLLSPPRAGGAGSSRLPFARLRLEACELLIDDVRVAVSGTISVPEVGAPAVDLVASSPSWRIGPVTFRDVMLRAQEADGGIRACVAARAAETAVEVCSSLPVSKPGEFRAIDVTWRAQATEHEAADWRARGRGHLVWSSGKGLAVEHGYVELVVPSHVRGAATLDNTRLSAEVTGSLSKLELATTGEVRAEQVVLEHAGSTTTLLDVLLPFSLDGWIGPAGFEVTTSKPLVAHARETTSMIADKVMRATRASIDFGDTDLRALVDGIGNGVWPETLPWTAAKVAWGELRFTGASGTLLEASRVGRWRATEARWRELRFEDASGTALGAKINQVHWRAARAKWRDARFTEPSGTIKLASTRTMRWQAKEGRWGGARFRAPTGRIDLEAPAAHQKVMWSGVRGPGPLALGPGEVVFRTDHMQVVGGTVQAMGGVVSVGSVVAGPRARLDLVLNARGLALQRVAAAISRGHVQGSGVLDGSLGLHLDESGWSLTSGSLRGRGAGALRITNPKWRERAAATTSQYHLHKKIAGALADFEYSRLAVAIDPRTGEPDLRISTRGRGKRVPQDIDLVINLRGVRHAVRRISAHVDQEQQ